MIVIRVLGVLLTLAASTVFGVYMASLGTFRRQDLLEFKKAFLILKSEIEYVAAPLPDAMANIAARVAEPIAQLFEDFAVTLRQNPDGESAYKLWLSAIETHRKATFLNEEDWEVIKSFGKTLGYLDKQMQVESINLANDYIDNQVTELQESSVKNQKMYKSLGVVGGLLLVVVFW